MPLGAALLLRSADRAGSSVALAILASAIIAGVFAGECIVNPLAAQHLLALALAGATGVTGKAIAALHVLVPGDWTVQRGHDRVERIEDDFVRALARRRCV